MVLNTEINGKTPNRNPDIEYKIKCNRIQKKTTSKSYKMGNGNSNPEL